MARTLNDHYLVVSVGSVQVDPMVAAKGPLLAVLAGLVAAAVPAWEASRVPPGVAMRRSHLELRMRRSVPAAGAAGVLSVLVSIGLLGLDSTSLTVGFASLFTLVLGFGLLAPGATWGLLWLAQPVGRLFGGSLGRLATRGAAASLSRTAVAVAALMVALAATVGVGSWSTAFAATWSTGSIPPYRRTSTSASLAGGRTAHFRPTWSTRLPRIPGVVDLSFGRSVEIHTGHGPVQLLVLRMAAKSYRGFHLLEGTPDRVWPQFDAGHGVLVSEPFAWREGLHPGDAIELQTDSGQRVFTIAGVYRDYESGHGTVVMSRSTYRAFWDDETLTGIGVYIAAGVDPEEVRVQLARRLPVDRHVVLQSTGAIKKASLEIFDRTFTITEVLRVLAAVVAFFGVLSALMALALERAREVAILRAQGATRGEVYALVQTQTGVLGLIAGLLALPLGLALAAVLVLVINRRSFGWGLELHVDPAILGQTLVLAVVAALLAGAYPALRMARTSPAEALRME